MVTMVMRLTGVVPCPLIYGTSVVRQQRSMGTTQLVFLHFPQIFVTLAIFFHYSCHKYKSRNVVV